MNTKIVKTLINQIRTNVSVYGIAYDLCMEYEDIKEREAIEIENCKNQGLTKSSDKLVSIRHEISSLENKETLIGNRTYKNEIIISVFKYCI